jgi:uncharacterized membrane protein
MAKPARTAKQSSANTVERLYRFLVPVALTCFVAAVLTDWAYARSATVEYSNASAWLLLFGLFAAGMTTGLLALSFMGGWLDRSRLWLSFGLFFAGFVVETINMMIHNRDGWTTVVPTGMTLSVIGAAIFLLGAWAGRTPLGSMAS